jgi:hypothetical protein
LYVGSKKAGRQKERIADEITKAKVEWKVIKYLKSERYKDGRS